MVLDIPQEWKCDGFEIVDDKNEKGFVQTEDNAAKSYPIIQSPNDTANMLPMVSHNVRAQVKDVPAMGYKHVFCQAQKEIASKSKVDACRAAGNGE